MLFLGMISGIHASVVGDLPVKPGPISGQTFGYTSESLLEFGPKSANELQFVSVRLEEQAEINSSTYGVRNARIFHTFESYEARDPHPAHFTAEANGTGVIMTIPLPVPCNAASTFGRTDGVREQSDIVMLFPRQLTEPANLCIFPLAYGDDEKMTLTLELSRANGAELFDYKWDSLAKCSGTKCKFENVVLGSVIMIEVQSGAFKIQEPILTIRKDGKYDYDLCLEGTSFEGSGSHSFSGTETSHPLPEETWVSVAEFALCEKIFPWWAILIIVLGSLIIIAGAVVGGIMCCYCGVCTCCGCCTRWAEKDATVDA